jgi:hypothetical protein
MSSASGGPARKISLKERKAIFRPERVAGPTHSTRHHNVSAVALANKLVRMAWAVLARNEPISAPDVGRCSYNLTGLQLTPDRGWDRIRDSHIDRPAAPTRS